MIKLYSTGILVGKFKDGMSQILDPYSNEFTTTNDNKDFMKYKIDPSKLIEEWESYQDFITSAINDAKNQFTTDDNRQYEKNNEFWIDTKTMEPIDIITKEDRVIGFVKMDRTATLVLVKDGEESNTPLKLYESIEENLYAVEDRGNFMVKMRDGISLATRVLMPKGKGICSVILYRTPYGIENYIQSNIHYVQRGYGVVIQDTRGRDDSEGEWIPCLYEADDGDDTLTWIGESDFCNGSIGMIGGSYSGYVQWAAASSSNPYLKAMVSIVTSGSAFVDLPYKGGCLMSGALAWVYAMSGRRIDPALMQRDDWDQLLQVKPVADIVKVGLNKEVDYWNKWCSEDKYTGFWDKQNWYGKREKMMDIPTLILSGWYDDNSMGTTEAIDVVNEMDFSNYRIILGPWLHKANSIRTINDIFLGKDALRYDVDHEYLMWFEEHLKGGREIRENEVQYYDVGTQTWIKSTLWPPSDKVLKLSLKDDLNAQGDYTSYTYNPDNPAPHIIDMSTNEAAPPGDYKEIEQRQDVITFTSNMLEKDISIAGDIIVNFYASSDRTDTDWVVRITDVDEIGHSIKVAENMIRAKYRNGFDKPELLEEDKVYSYKIRTSKVGNTFKKGHRIRLMITSSARGYIFANTNTGNNPVFDTTFKIAEQRIHHNGKYNSYIELPIV